MNSKNSKITDSHRLSINFTEKINVKKSDKYVVLSNLSIYYTWKNIKKSCKFKIPAPETMKLLESTKSKITKNGNDENASYQQHSRVFYTFTPNKSFGQLFDISPKNIICLKHLTHIYIFIY